MVVGLAPLAIIIGTFYGKEHTPGQAVTSFELIDPKLPLATMFDDVARVLLP